MPSITTTAPSHLHPTQLPIDCHHRHAEWLRGRATGPWLQDPLLPPLTAIEAAGFATDGVLTGRAPWLAGLTRRLLRFMQERGVAVEEAGGQVREGEEWEEG